MKISDLLSNLSKWSVPIILLTILAIVGFNRYSISDRTQQQPSASRAFSPQNSQLTFPKNTSKALIYATYERDNIDVYAADINGEDKILLFTIPVPQNLSNTEFSALFDAQISSSKKYIAYRTHEAPTILYLISVERGLREKVADNAYLYKWDHTKDIFYYSVPGGTSYFSFDAETGEQQQISQYGQYYLGALTGKSTSYRIIPSPFLYPSVIEMLDFTTGVTTEIVLPEKYKQINLLSVNPPGNRVVASLSPDAFGETTECGFYEINSANKLTVLTENSAALCSSISWYSQNEIIFGAFASKDADSSAQNVVVYDLDSSSQAFLLQSDANTNYEYLGAVPYTGFLTQSYSVSPEPAESQESEISIEKRLNFHYRDSGEIISLETSESDFYYIGDVVL